MWFLKKRNEKKEACASRISRAVYAAADRIAGERRARYAVTEDSPYAKELTRVAARLEGSEALLRGAAELIGSALPSRDPRKEQELEEAWRRAEEELDRILRGLDARLLVAGDAVERVAKDVRAAADRYLSL